MKFHFLLSSLACCASLVSCSHTYRASGAPGALAKRVPARVTVKEDYSGDNSTRLAIGRELRERGFPVTEEGKSGLTVKMADLWRWDLVMYLRELELTFVDPVTGAVRAEAYYRNSLFHTFPSQAGVVDRLFEEMDKKGIFGTTTAVAGH